MSRTTPDSDDLMPEVLELLKREKKMKKKDISIHMRAWIERSGFDHRDRSIGWALNRLCKENYVENPRRGIWQITDKGMASWLTPEKSHEIMKRWTERERSARKP